MPGTIQLSVLDLVDLPQPEPRTTLFSLKIIMGKREYQSIGKQNFSFPVMSLLGNLTVILHDSDGNEMLQTEFRTISVVEKGILVDSFPLKCGGFVHMKLQFSLSQEERLRIHEMRETILKRKRGEELKTGVKGYVSDDSESSGTPSLQVSEGHPEDSFEKGVSELIEANKEKVKTVSPLDGTHNVQISSDEGLDPQSGSSTCLASGKVKQFKNSLSAEMKEDQIQQTTISADDVQIISEEGFDPQSISSMSLISQKTGQYHNSISADMKEDKIRSKVRKMISAFEGNRSQELQFSGTRLKYCEDKVDMEGEMKRAQADDGNGSFEQSVSNHPCSKTTYRQESSVCSVTKEDERLRSFSGEEIGCGNPNETGELVAYVINEGCPFQNLGIWTTRHVCITTGSRQLRDLAECCHNSRQSPPMEKKDTSMTTADDKIPHYDASTQDNENEKISSCTSGKPDHEKSVGISKLCGGLIEQGVRVAILIVACGTLLYNTRQRS